MRNSLQISRRHRPVASASHGRRACRIQAGNDQGRGFLAYLGVPEFKTVWDLDAARLTQAVRRMGKLE
ncbi:MAG: hypothetical protein U1C47_04835, partial [Hydrogenophaga sp.]|jgi:hypothetical protein|nr:hypothetical protein [Hydrogenophaga sp.]